MTDVYYYCNYISAGWLALQSITLISSPTIIATLLSPEVRETTVLEAYLSRSLGIAQLTLAALMVVTTGSVPLTTEFSDAADMADAANPKAPFAVPTLTINMFYHTAIAFLAYSQWAAGTSTVYMIAFVMSGIMASVGGWQLLFGTKKGRIASTVGVEKASGFPFKNKEADKKKGRLAE
ncbi:hypothetical protein BJ508DRAFT_411731 [Ascobolus immersus RN42]|uniref:Uncharacterized protein n=1 Tax=Ascobolus immersus RN42 TaxID=1160509 RepID=A0A3N4IHX7_ASCIM|nr:hypothetical protein BJ508DRAFT_411731 [Ascobolus immersus RN42]